MGRPRLAVWKLSSCDGCQLSILDCEDELLAVAGAVEIAHFIEATSTISPGPYDISLVEGSITTAHEAERIREIRRISKVLVTIGACATAGGVQALRNYRDHPAMMAMVYARPDWLSSLPVSTAVAEHVAVDLELRGCPVDKHQLVEVLVAYLHGRKPRVRSHAVCGECKAKGTVCVVVAHGQPCLGPITHAGCGALCPGYTRGCYGCFGPSDTPRTAALARALTNVGTEGQPLHDLLSTFNAAAAPFRDEATRHGHD